MCRPIPCVLSLLVGTLGPAAGLAAGLPATVVVGAGVDGARLVAQGEVVAVRQAQLSAQVTGRVTEVLVRSGEVVHRGEVLLRIDSPASQASAAAETAQAGAAAAQLATARADFQRARQLHDKAYISDAAFERAQARLQAVEAQSTAAVAHAHAARAVAGWAELRAPYDGRATVVKVAAGDLASPGQALVDVYAPGAMRIVADIPEDSAGDLAAELPVQISYDGAGCAAAARETRSWVAVPAIDPRSRSVQVRVEIGSAPGCIPGTLARVSMPLHGTQALLVVPESAVVRRGELQAVYVVDDHGRQSLRQVRLGEPRGADIEVLAGLEPGEKVVRDAARLRPGPAGAGAP